MEDSSADSETPDSGDTAPRRRRTLGDALARLDAAQIAAGVPVAQIYGAGLPADEVRDQLAAVLPTRFVPDDLITWFGWRNGATSALAHHQAVLSPDGGDRLFGLSETIEWYERTIHSFRSLPADDPQALWAGLWGLNLQLWSSTGSDQWFVELRPTASEPLPIQRIMLGDEPMAFRPPEPALPRRNLAAYIRHQARAWLELAMADHDAQPDEHPAGSPFAKVAQAGPADSAFTPARRGDDSPRAIDPELSELGSTLIDRDAADPDDAEAADDGFGLNLFVPATVEHDRRADDPTSDTGSDESDDDVARAIEDVATTEGALTTTEGESIQ